MLGLSGARGFASSKILNDAPLQEAAPTLDTLLADIPTDDPAETIKAVEEKAAKGFFASLFAAKGDAEKARKIVDSVMTIDDADEAGSKWVELLNNGQLAPADFIAYLKKVKVD